MKNLKHSVTVNGTEVTDIDASVLDELGDSAVEYVGLKYARSCAAEVVQILQNGIASGTEWV